MATCAVVCSGYWGLRPGHHQRLQPFDQLRVSEAIEERGVGFDRLGEGWGDEGLGFAVDCDVFGHIKKVAERRLKGNALWVSVWMFFVNRKEGGNPE